MTFVDARGVVVRLLMVLPVLLWLIWGYGTDIAHELLSPFRVVLGWMVSHLGVLRLDVVFQAPQHQFFAEVAVGKLMVLNGQVLNTGSVLRASVPVYIGLVPLLIILTIALAWKGLPWRGRLLRLAISLPIILVLQIVDAPVVLAIAIQESVGAAGVAVSPLVAWIRFMDGGGRYALAIGAALLASDVHERLIQRFAGPSGGDTNPIALVAAAPYKI
jgi:hypothetical protein